MRAFSRRNRIASSKILFGAGALFSTICTVVAGAEALSGSCVRRTSDEKQCVGDCPSWMWSYAALHAGTLKEDAAGGAGRFAVWTCGSLLRGHNDCSGWGNRLLGIVSVFLFAVLTDRAMLIEWPDAGPLGLDNFLRSDLIDWRIPATFKGRKTRFSPDSLFIGNTYRNQSRLEFFFRSEDPWAVSEQLVWIRAKEGLFHSMWQNPFAQQRLCEMGLSHVDSIFSLLSRVLFRPHGQLKAALRRLEVEIAGRPLLALQMRFRSDFLDVEPGIGFTAADMDRFYASALAAETSQEKDGRGSAWFLATDSMAVVKSVFEGPYAGKVIWVNGTMAHLTVIERAKSPAEARLAQEEETETLLKIFVDFWMVVLADYAVISGQSTYGLTARGMRYDPAQMDDGTWTGSYTVFPAMSATDLQASCKALPSKLHAVMCGPSDTCFDGPFGFTLPHVSDCEADFGKEVCLVGQPSHGSRTWDPDPKCEEAIEWPDVPAVDSLCDGSFPEVRDMELVKHGLDFYAGILLMRNGTFVSGSGDSGEHADVCLQIGGQSRIVSDWFEWQNIRDGVCLVEWAINDILVLEASRLTLSDHSCFLRKSSSQTVKSELHEMVYLTCRITLPKSYPIGTELKMEVALNCPEFDISSAAHSKFVMLEEDIRE